MGECPAAVARVRWTRHCGAKSGHCETSEIHFPTSSGVSEVSEQASEGAQWSARAKRVMRSKRCGASGAEQAVRSKRLSEWKSK